MMRLYAYQHKSRLVRDFSLGQQVLDLLVGLVGHPVVDVHTSQFRIDDEIHFVHLVLEHVGNALLYRKSLGNEQAIHRAELVISACVQRPHRVEQFLHAVRLHHAQFALYQWWIRSVDDKISQLQSSAV